MNRCDLCKGYYEPTSKQWSARLANLMDGCAWVLANWLCPACLEARAKEESLPFNMDYDDEED